MLYLIFVMTWIFWGYIHETHYTSHISLQIVTILHAHVISAAYIQPIISVESLVLYWYC